MNFFSNELNSGKITHKKLITLLLKEFDNPKILASRNEQGLFQEKLDTNYYLDLAYEIALYEYDVDKELFEWYLLNPNNQNLKLLTTFLHIYWLKRRNLYIPGVNILVDIFPSLVKESEEYLYILNFYCYIILFKGYNVSRETKNKMTELIMNDMDLIKKNILVINSSLYKLIHIVDEKYKQVFAKK